MKPIERDSLEVGQRIRLYWKEADGRPAWAEGLVTQIGRLHLFKVDLEQLAHSTDLPMVGRELPLYNHDILFLVDELRYEQQDLETLAYIKSRLGGVDYEDIRKAFDEFYSEYESMYQHLGKLTDDAWEDSSDRDINTP